MNDDDYDSSDSDEEEIFLSRQRYFDLGFFIKLFVICILACFISLVVTPKVIQYYFLPVPNQDLPSPPTHFAIRQVKKDELLLMWEPSLYGDVHHYRIYRWNNFLGQWNELYHSPTQKLGTKDTFLPSIWNNGTKIRYKIVAENKVNQSYPVEVWFNIGYPYLDFNYPTSSLAPKILQTPLRLLDISFNKGEEKIHIEWDRPTDEKILGYEVYRWNKFLRVYDEIERYDSIRNYSRSIMPNYPTEELYCFVVKAVIWGDVGTSAPSYPRCIFIKNWNWELNEIENNQEDNKENSKMPRYQQLSFWRKLYPK